MSSVRYSGGTFLRHRAQLLQLPFPVSSIYLITAMLSQMRTNTTKPLNGTIEYSGNTEDFWHISDSQKLKSQNYEKTESYEYGSV